MWADFHNRISDREKDLTLYPLRFQYDVATKAPYDLLTPKNTLGLMGQLIGVKKENPKLTVSASVIGWTFSGAFQRIIRNLIRL